MLSVIQAIILGIVEGITEFLPISSTGHLILASALLRIPESEFLKSFEIVIQLGAIAAVVVLYFRKLWSWEVIKRLGVAFVPTGIIGAAVYPFVKGFLLGNIWITVAALGLGGVALIFFERGRKTEFDVAEVDVATLPYKTAFLIGLCQAVAIIPGVSRSAATIIGAMLLGQSRRAAVEFSFLLAVPTIAAASAFDIFKNWTLFSAANFGLLSVGFVAAFVTALAVVLWLLRFVRNHTLVPFGLYRIVLAILFLLWIL